MILIEYKEKKYSFGNSMTLTEYFDFQDNYGKKTSIDSEKWWLTKSQYGEDLLQHISKIELPEIPEEDWSVFHPVFAGLFPTPEEYYIILNNLRFLHGQSVGVVENSWFVKYLLMKECGELTLKDISNMNVKDALMLYYYIINDRLVELYGLQLLDKAQENDESMII